MTSNRRRRESLGRVGLFGLAAALLIAGCGPAVASPLPPAGSATQSQPVPSSSPSGIAPSAAAWLPLGAMPNTVFTGARADALQAALDAAVRAGAPDVIAAVVTESGSWAGAAGIAGPGGRKATSVDMFAIASLSKTFTAALVMRLVEKGRMDLDAPLARYLGDLEFDANGATLRQTLEMRAGLAEHRSDIADRIVADPAKAWTMADRIAGYLPPVGEPGGYAYSSPSYEVLAYAVEQVTGRSYGSALRAEILDPVGATRILDQEAGGLTPQPWALPIGEHLGRFDAEDMGAGGALSCLSSSTSGTGAGSIASDAPSLAAWLWHLFAGDILTESTVAAMFDAGQDEWAYGWDRAPYSEARAVASSGNKTGYGSQWVLFPASRAIVVIFVNDPDFIVEPTVTALLNAAVAR